MDKLLAFNIIVKSYYKHKLFEMDDVIQWQNRRKKYKVGDASFLEKVGWCRLLTRVRSLGGKKEKLLMWGNLIIWRQKTYDILFMIFYII